MSEFNFVVEQQQVMGRVWPGLKLGFFACRFEMPLRTNSQFLG
jgi:hypothetical protein